MTFDRIFCAEVIFKRNLAEVSSHRLLQNAIYNTSELNLTSAQCLKPLTKNTSIPVYSIGFYFGRNEDIPEDFTPKLLNKTTNASCFKDFVMTNVIGIPEIININYRETIPDVIPGYDSEEKILDIKGYSWAYIDNIKLTGNGIVYYIFNQYSNQTGLVPLTPTQIKFGYTTLNQKSLSYARKLFLLGVTDEVNTTFSPLKSNTSYEFNMVFTNENPFNSESYSTVQTIKLTTKPVGVLGSLELLNLIHFLLGFLLLYVPII